MNDQPSPLTDQQLDEIVPIATRATDDPFFVSDCEGSLQVWHERALVRVTRNSAGEITSYDFPFAFPPAEQIIELDLGSWDPGEDATDDKRRQDITDLVDARAALPALLAEVLRLRASATDLATRWEKEAAGTQQAIDSDPLGGEVESAQHERVHVYRTAAEDLRTVLVTGQVPEDLLTQAERAAVETGV